MSFLFLEIQDSQTGQIQLRAWRSIGFPGVRFSEKGECSEEIRSDPETDTVEF